ncbi:MAG: hypothetical protein NW226_12165 [Microscillaceae bacterium]|nr:hypothetical protein [Microscillaceae bacterium]
MKKPKKITVKFFLNRNLQFIEIDGEECHPLYTQVTYDRKNTQIKCAYGWFYKDLKQVREKEPFLLEFEEKVLKKSVDYELSIHGENFRLKGLGKKYESYGLSIHALFNSYLKIRFKNIIKEAKPDKFLDVLNLERNKLDFFTIFEAAQRLFDNLDAIMQDDFSEEMEIYRVYYRVYEQALNSQEYRFPVVIDWLEGTHQKQLEAQLREPFNHQESMVEKSLSLIHKIVSTKLE